MQTYDKARIFEHVYFEDSYVTRIEADESLVEFRLDLVLRRGHPKFHQPPANEQYCYATALLKFSEASSITWKRISMRAAIDKNNSVDFGNIDSFQIDADNFWLAGDWGEVVISGARVDLLV
jgi:hypothetical protein